MPSPILEDWALIGLSSISFFGLVFLVATAVIRWLWNSLARDFAQLPRLSYANALAAVTLVGSLLAVVLTMIAGARELMTPGAWVKQGVLYAVAAEAEPTAESKAEDWAVGDLGQRRQAGLQQLQAALWNYAAAHDGQFPVKDQAPFDPALWQIPAAAGVEYVLVPDRRLGEPSRLLAFEPSVFAGPRWVLYTTGESALLSGEEIRSALQAEEDRLKPGLQHVRAEEDSP